MKNYEDDEMGVLTVDIGGSHLTSAMCNKGSNIDFDTFHRVEFSSKATAAIVITDWCNCLQHSLNAANVSPRGIAFAMPGPFDYTNGISWIRGLNKYEALYGLNLKSILSDRLGIEQSKFRFRNDAEATIAGEVQYGSGSGYNRVLGVTLGTGFGSAFSDGKNTIDINLGSEPFKETIADDHLSTRWFQKRHLEITGLSIGGVKDLAALADERSTPRPIFKEFAENFVEFTLPYIEAYRPDAIVLCGNIAKASRHFLTRISKNINVPVVVGSLGEHAALIGAADLFKITDPKVIA